ncbi:MAG: Ornithine cyclodeaminase, partial [uncultured Thermomicrobiales bacterium]
ARGLAVANAAPRRGARQRHPLHAGRRRRARRAGAEGRLGLSDKRGAWAADDPRAGGAPRRGDRAAAGPARRHLPHRAADRRGVGQGDRAPGPARRGGANPPLHRRGGAGVHASLGGTHRPAVARARPRLVTDAGARRGAGVATTRRVARGRGAGRGRARPGGGGARGRYHLHRDPLADAGLRRRLAAPRHAHQRSRRLHPGDAGDPGGDGRARPRRRRRDGGGAGRGGGLHHPAARRPRRARTLRDRTGAGGGRHAAGPDRAGRDHALQVGRQRGAGHRGGPLRRRARRGDRPRPARRAV